MEKQIIDYIITQYKQIQGELMLQEVMANEVDDKVAELIQKTPNGFTGLITEIVAYQELSKQKQDLINRLEYLKGMFEAYGNIIQELKKQE